MAELKERLIVSCFISVLLTSLIVLTSGNLAKANFSPQPELPDSIFILEDGSIEPSHSPIEHAGDYYTLMDKINVTIEIQRDNIVFDGNNNILTRPKINASGLMTPIGWLPSIYVLNRNNVTIKNTFFNTSSTGVSARSSSNITVINNVFKYNGNGIVFWNCRNCTIVANKMSKNSHAIHFLESNINVDIKYNDITESRSHAIWGCVTRSEILYNNIENNSGVALYEIGTYNIIAYNNLECNDYGILGNVFNNTIHHNNFIDNKEQQFISSGHNTFDDEKKGNYWSDYTGEDSNQNGIGETPYSVYQNETDRYPLMEPVEIPKYGAHDEIPEFSNWIIAPVLFATYIVVAVYRKKLVHKFK